MQWWCFLFLACDNMSSRKGAAPNTGHTIWFYLGTSAQRQKGPVQLGGAFSESSQKGNKNYSTVLTEMQV